MLRSHKAGEQRAARSKEQRAKSNWQGVRSKSRVKRVQLVYKQINL